MEIEIWNNDLKESAGSRILLMILSFLFGTMLEKKEIEDGEEACFLYFFLN
jgi:hypothetical protein